MGFIKVAETEEIPTGKMKMIKLQEKEILIVNVGGNYYAIGNRCTHAGGNLSNGYLEGTIVTCPKHGSKFDVITGKAILGPKIVFVRLKTKDEPKFEVNVEGKSILLKTD